MADTTDEEIRHLHQYDIERANLEKLMRPLRRNVRLFLIRHGESTVNEVGTLIGGRASHASLSEKGEAQSLKLGSHFAASNIKFDLVFSSTSQRSIQTAELVCKETGTPTEIIVTSDDLLEQCHGGWEGRKRDEVYTSEMLAFLEHNTWQYRPPGLSPDNIESESQRQVEERMSRFVEQHILTLKEGDDKKKVWNVAIFGHGLSIKFFLRSIMQSSPYMSRKMRLDNCAIVEVGYETAAGHRGGWQIYRINDHAHIKDEKVFTRLPTTPTSSRKAPRTCAEDD